MKNLQGVLSHDELERAGRFKFDRDNRRFVVSRGLLRDVLSRYAGIDPALLRFTYGPKGKPGLETTPPNTGLHFNLSHAHELMMIAISVDTPLGIDVEYVRELPDLDDIARGFFSASEYSDLRRTPRTQRTEAFFNCWTRKEAYVKAIGDGLSAPLDRFDVTLTPGEPARIRGFAGDPANATRWSLYHLEPEPGYVGALAVKGNSWNIQARRWPVAHNADILEDR
jgi:4'-phosphopantetheinyl transferase